MQRGFVSLACVACGIAGCSLLVDTSNLAGQGADAGPVPSASAMSSPPDATALGIDAPASDGSSTSCPAGALVCEDFEAGIGKWETRADTNGTIELVTDLAHSGRAAVRATTAAATGDFAVEIRHDLTPIKTGLFVFHAWMFFTGKYADRTALVKLHAVTGSFDMNLKLHDNGKLQVDADVPGAGVEPNASDPVPFERWVCVEWQATLGTPGHSKVIVDGKTVIDADENTVPPDGYDKIGIGFVGLAGPEQRVFMDDIVLATAPVGCP